MGFMAQNITSNSTTSVTLTSNPVSVSATIDVTTGDAVYGLGSAPWTVNNSGVIIAGGSAGNGITLTGGSFVNAATGAISTGNPSAQDAIIIGTGTAGGVGTVDNFGVLSDLATAGVQTNFVVELDSSGTIINEATGVIRGFNRGVGIRNDANNSSTESVANSGLINGGGATSGYGVATTGGVITNYSGGTISNWANGVELFGAGLVTNAGSIVDTTGVSLQAGGIVSNQASGFILAGAGTLGAGIYATGSRATVMNAGTIEAAGGSGTAVGLVEGGLVIAEPGGVFDGTVAGGGGTLELAAGSETVSRVTNFGSILFDPGATADAGGTAAGFNDATVTGFTAGDMIAISGANDTISGLAGGTLTLGGTAPIALVVGSGLPVADYQVQSSAGTTDLTVIPCFVEGTHILTDAGEIAVEALRPGMAVVSVTHRRPLAVRWVGSCGVSRAAPARIAVGALGEGLPHRELWLSPDHAVLIDGALMPVRYLINGTTVAEVSRDSFTYFHVELEQHAALLAEGLPAESYLDTGNRASFENLSSSTKIPPIAQEAR